MSSSKIKAVWLHLHMPGVESYGFYEVSFPRELETACAAAAAMECFHEHVDVELLDHQCWELECLMPHTCEYLKISRADDNVAFEGQVRRLDGRELNDFATQRLAFPPGPF